MGAFDTTPFMPHGHCYLWRPELVLLMAGSDLLIGLSYAAISLSLLLLVRRVRIPFSWAFVAFGVFIAACGLGHLFDIVTIWNPRYWETAGIRVVTALASVTTAVALVPLLPRVVAAVRDLRLSEERRVLLEAEQERFQLLVQSVRDHAIYMLDPEGRVASWNAGAERLKGFQAPEILGRHFRQFHSPEDVERGVPERSLREALETGQCAGEGWIVRKDGSRFYGNTILTTLRAADGSVRGFARVVRDVTEKKKAEDALQRAYQELERRVQERTEELQASQREYQEMVNTIDGVVWEAEVGKPKYTFVSRQAERILGYPIERWLGENGFWQSVLHPEDRANLTGEMYRTAAAKKDSQVEYRLITADGSTIWVKDYIRVIYESGNPVKMRGIMVDISDRKRAEAKLKRAQDTAIRASQVKSEFLANISHEIRTPMNAIIGMATVGLDDDLSDRQRECLTTIKTAADSLLGLINDLLDFSKIEAGKVELEVSSFELMSVVRNAMDVIAPIAKNRFIAVDLEADPGLPARVKGDPGRLLQILLNLLGNAVKFTAPRTGQVRLRVRPAAGRVRFEIADNGAGIPDELKGRLFQPFSQGDSSTARKFGGTGLGLSICRRLVLLMKGEIGVESEPGRGATFWFELPLPESTDPAPELDSARPAAPSSARGGPARILVAEDNPANRMVILRLLSKLGHHAEVVGDGAEALAAYQTGAFDLILMDCQMPEMDGYEATRRIRALEAGGHRARIPIVALTAHALSGDRQRCREAGMDDYLSKPITPTQLDAAIRAWATDRQQLPAPVAPPAAPRASDAADIDWKHIESLESLQIPGHPDVVVELIDCLRAAAPEKLHAMEEALRGEDREGLRKAAHFLKSTCHNVGARRLAALCEELELAAGSAEKPFSAAQAERTLGQARSEYAAVEGRLRDCSASRSARPR